MSWSSGAPHEGSRPRRSLGEGGVGWSQVPLASLILPWTIPPWGLRPSDCGQGKPRGTLERSAMLGWSPTVCPSSCRVLYSHSSFQTYKGGIIILTALDEETEAKRCYGVCPSYTVRNGRAGIWTRVCLPPDWMPFNWKGLNENRRSLGQHPWAELSWGPSSTVCVPGPQESEGRGTWEQCFPRASRLLLSHEWHKIHTQETGGDPWAQGTPAWVSTLPRAQASSHEASASWEQGCVGVLQVG